MQFTGCGVMEPNLRQLKEYTKYLLEYTTIDYIKKQLSKASHDPNLQDFVKVDFEADYEYDDEYSYYFTVYGLKFTYEDGSTVELRDLFEEDWEIRDQVTALIKDIVPNMENYNSYSIVVKDLKKPFDLQISNPQIV